MTPSIGTRIALSGYLGTIRYVGEVEGTKGTWLGVEWDDPSRGRHDGVKDGKRYFTCLVPNSGSFIRPTATIDYGKPFLRALIEKYIELPQGSQETVILGSSNGAIEVEAVNLDKIRGKLSQLERLRAISLDRESVSSVGPPGEIRSKCTSVKTLDLSYSLIPSWDVVALIADELPQLERLALNDNRFQPLQSPELARRAFENLIELELNSSLVPWQDMLEIVHLIPSLKNLEFGYNHLEKLCPFTLPSGFSSNLEVLNLYENKLSDWVDVTEALQPFPRLTRLILSSNPLALIPFLSSDKSSTALLSLKHLALTSTKIASWSSIDALSRWCPALEGFHISEVPITDEDSEAGRAWRQLIIARIPTLLNLDGTTITSRLRMDSELFYLSYIARTEWPSEDALRAEHPRWDELCNLHGAPIPVASHGPKEDKLSNRLIQLSATMTSTSPPTPTSLSTPIAVRVLPTAPLRHLRLKLLKSFKAPRGSQTEVWLKMADGKFSELGGGGLGDESAEEAREVEWWLEEGSELAVFIKK
ncbi:uncharacterized protein STEHIDRAFT_166103 [Stereum hirsutum FP-91666 SS1]|uniref:uncharacterized protein n=1 Tax=Stereum hirsutum (strain FP-91666) TaxID=721885 RepID=UPI000440E5F2|nr:uncharacterized protein STEHIDRAFT_166103 [Stereum hirsutum FP-91666 SS1]EIM89769.1 hypothetical protein STEHIDRAFT_166103 [Stereum hirsutum FP-91666 SS1]